MVGVEVGIEVEVVVVVVFDDTAAISLTLLLSPWLALAIARG